jgi:glutathione S-transferase
MLTVHHLGISQSERIVWLCEELGIDYELKVYERDPVTRMAPAAYKALHPVGTAPIITDGAVVLPESGAIIDYIIGKYGNGRLAVGPQAANFADYLFWLHFSNASMLPRQTVRMGQATDQEETPRARFLRERAEKSWDLVEQRLGETAYFAGDELTAADIMWGFTLTTMRYWAPMDISGKPNILAYLQRIGARPAYQRAMAKGDSGMTPMLT